MRTEIREHFDRRSVGASSSYPTPIALGKLQYYLDPRWNEQCGGFDSLWGVFRNPGGGVSQMGTASSLMLE